MNAHRTAAIVLTATAAAAFAAPAPAAALQMKVRKAVYTEVRVKGGHELRLRIFDDGQWEATSTHKPRKAGTVSAAMRRAMDPRKANGSLPPDGVTRLRAAMAKAAFKLETPAAMCDALPDTRWTLIGSKAMLTWQAPCSSEPDKGTQALIALAHELLGPSSAWVGVVAHGVITQPLRPDELLRVDLHSIAPTSRTTRPSASQRTALRVFADGAFVASNGKAFTNGTLTKDDLALLKMQLDRTTPKLAPATGGQCRARPVQRTVVMIKRGVVSWARPCAGKPDRSVVDLMTLTTTLTKVPSALFDL